MYDKTAVLFICYRIVRFVLDVWNLLYYKYHMIKCSHKNKKSFESAIRMDDQKCI